MSAFLRYSQSGPNIWTVKRGAERVAEVVLDLHGECTFIPFEARAFSLDELFSIWGFMNEAHKQDSAVVLPMEGVCKS